MKTQTVVVLALAWTAALTAQQPPQPVFRSAVDIVAVDVTVVDGDGRQVPDLGVDDFALMVDGQARRVVSADYVALSTATPQKTSVPLAYSTNEGATPGRLIILVVDQGNIRTGVGRQNMHAAGAFLDRLAPQDRVALTTIPGPGPRIEFTTNRRIVKEALTRVYGQSDYDFGPYNIGLVEAQAFEHGDRVTMDEVVQRECARDGGTESGCPERGDMEARQIATAIRQRMLASLRGLDEVINLYKPIDAPKTILLISEGLLIEDLIAEVSDLAAAVTSTRTSIYVLHLETPRFDATQAEIPPTPAADADAQLNGLETLAGMARGTLYKLIGTGEIAFERIIREISGYYLLGFEPQAVDRNGRPHKIAVTVRRRGLTVRARRDFTVPPVSTRPRTNEDVLAEALHAPFLATELPIKLATYTLHDAGTERMRVVVSADIDRGLTGPTDIAVGYSLLDDRGRLAASTFQPMQLEPKGGSRPGPLHYEGVAIVDPGLYTLKFGAVDQNGRRGTVEHPVRATLTRMADRDLIAGDLMVAPASQPGPNADPTIREGALAAYLELYSTRTDQLTGAGVTVEIATDEAAPALVRQPARLSGVGDGYRRSVEATVETRLLPPGEYVARAVIALSGRTVGRLTRPFRVEPGEGASASTTAVAARSLAAPGFRVESVLAPAVVRAVLDRMIEFAPGPSSAVSAAIERARSGTFDDPAAAASDAKPELAPAFLRGLAHLSRRELEPAAAHFRTALRLSSEFLPAALYLGACYAAGGRDQEAVGAWQTFLITGSDLPIVYSLLADAHLRLNDSAQAIDILTEAAERWPADEDLRWQLATAHATAGHAGDALVLLDAHLERRSDHHEALFLALRIMYEAQAAGRPLGQPAAIRQKFDGYAKRYAALKGPELPIVQHWQRFLTQTRP